MVSVAQRDKVLGYIETGKREGARLVTGGGVPELQGFENGAWIQPTVFARRDRRNGNRARGNLRAGD